jgi:polyribonucleotide nucleotidyltransferase
VSLFNIRKEELDLEGKTYTVETGKMARQADGAVTVRCGDTMVLVTAVASSEPRDTDFFPLTVDVEEKMYAAGKIPGGFIKREGRPSEQSILTARLIDRPLRPSFPDGFRNEVQVIVTTLSVDLVNPPDVLALLGASTALSISDIPFNGPVAAARIGRVDGQWIINPTFQDLDASDLDLIVSGNREAIVMVEAGAHEVPEADMVEALSRAHEAIKRLIEFQDRMVAAVAPVKREFVAPVPNPEVEARVRTAATTKIDEALRNPDKLGREAAVKAAKAAALTELEDLTDEHSKLIKALTYKIEKELVRRMVLSERRRVDGRALDEIREIDIEVGVLPRGHGSGLFTRGQTQALSALTLGTVSETQTIDGIGIEEFKRYIHHYNFPPFSTGETGFMRGPKRREIGHGALAERALLPTIPGIDEFPYTIRIVSEVLESNGSSSMASVCGSTLALMDAGVPLKAPVAGIAMGLVKDGDEFAVLTDIQGIEDALGDMDFKVAGTRKGITALQMDMKVTGCGPEILTQALEQARQAREYIIGLIEEKIPSPREELSQYAPRVISIKIPVDKIRDVIGPGGKMIRSIIEETGASIDVEDDGTIFIASRDGEGGEKAKGIIQRLTKEVEKGERYMGTVTKTTAFGAFVEMYPGREGLVHISKLSKRRINKVEDVINNGDQIEVEVLGVDHQGKVSLVPVTPFE